jgi:hypothetical protein
MVSKYGAVYVITARRYDRGGEAKENNVYIYTLYNIQYTLYNI